MKNAKPKLLLPSDKCMASRSKHLNTPDDKIAADRKHLTRLVIFGYSSEPAISTGSGIFQMPSNLPHTNRTMCKTCVNLPNHYPLKCKESGAEWL